MVVNLVGMVLTVIGLAVFAVLRGKFERIFEELGIRLPGITEFLLVSWVPWLFGILLLALFGAGLALRKDPKVSTAIAGTGIVGLFLAGALMVIAFFLPLIQTINALDSQAT